MTDKVKVSSGVLVAILVIVSVGLFMWLLKWLFGDGCPFRRYECDRPPVLPYPPAYPYPPIGYPPVGYPFGGGFGGNCGGGFGHGFGGNCGFPFFGQHGHNGHNGSHGHNGHNGHHGQHGFPFYPPVINNNVSYDEARRNHGHHNCGQGGNGGEEQTAT